MTTLSATQLNRTLLHRQLLLERRRRPLTAVVGRLVALQAQYAPSPYVALWSRIDGFRKEQLTGALRSGTVVKAGVLRGTLHVGSRELYPFIEAAHIESQAGESTGVARRRVAAHEPSPSVLWREPLQSPEEGTARVARAYLAA